MSQGIGIYPVSPPVILGGIPIVAVAVVPAAATALIDGLTHRTLTPEQATRELLRQIDLDPQKGVEIVQALEGSRNKTYQAVGKIGRVYFAAPTTISVAFYTQLDPRIKSKPSASRTGETTPHFQMTNGSYKPNASLLSDQRALTLLKEKSVAPLYQALNPEKIGNVTEWLALRKGLAQLVSQTPAAKSPYSLTADDFLYGSPMIIPESVACKPSNPIAIQASIENCGNYLEFNFKIPYPIDNPTIGALYQEIGKNKSCEDFPFRTEADFTAFVHSTTQKNANTLAKNQARTISLSFQICYPTDLESKLLTPEVKTSARPPAPIIRDTSYSFTSQ